MGESWPRSCVQASLRSVSTYDLDQDSPIQTSSSVKKSQLLARKPKRSVIKLLIFFLFFRRKLTRVQWASLLILFLSIGLLSNEKKELEHSHHRRIIGDFLPAEVQSTLNGHESDTCQKLRQTSGSRNITDFEGKLGVFRASQGHILVLTQCALSSLANIYNEKIFKEGQGMEDSILLQNTKLYMFGVFFNTVTLFLRPEFRYHVVNCGLFYGYNRHATLLIVVTAFFGLTVALILKFRDNMFQVMSSQLTNVVMITSSVLFLDFHPTLMFFLTAPVVLLAIFIFNAGVKVELVSPREKQDTQVWEREKTEIDLNNHVDQQLIVVKSNQLSL